ncbi:MAG: DUF4272 domain-containing protein [Lachnospiraceae bacterium]|nr:DUF4272 domain-containing protein [Lachnospiraceae bacterium]
MEENLIVLFSREQDPERIMDVIMESFGLEKSSGGNNLHLENDVQSVNIDVFTESMGKEFKEFIQKQKNMVSGYFAQMQNCNEDIKINLIHHIQHAKAFVPIKTAVKQENGDVDDIDAVIAVILEAIKHMDGVLIVDEGATALNSDGDVILSEECESNLEFYFPFELQERPAFLENCTERQITRRTENMKYLYDRKIYVCELPLNDDDGNIRLRSQEDVVRRTIGTLIVSLYSEALLNPEENMSVSEARDFIRKVMKDFSVDKLEDVLTDEEMKYIEDDNSDEAARINFSWHYENLYVLEWILGLVEWNYPDGICDVGKMVRNLRKFDSVGKMCKKTVLRSKKEILDKADLIYRMDWAAVDARIHGMQGPAGLEHGVVQERHKTLNWMICFDNAEWDDVSTPT